VTPVFVDTSAAYAVLDAADANHAAAAERWTALLDLVVEGEVDLISHGGVVVECTALVQHRLGLAAVRALVDDLLPVVDVRWPDARLHERAVSALLAAGRRDVSLVDWMSFELMRGAAVRHAFAFDDDFAQQGFVAWPAG